MYLGGVHVSILQGLGLGALLVLGAPMAAHAQSGDLAITGDLDDSRLSQIIGEISEALDTAAFQPAAPSLAPLARDADSETSASCDATGRAPATMSDVELTAGMVSLLSQNITNQLASMPTCSVEARSGVLSAANMLATVDFAPLEHAAACGAPSDGLTAAATRVLADRDDLQSQIRTAEEACEG
ncbi:MAG: hypothetical protein BM562_06865 [Alphaproteobacteria bacterium MedPE-SWcel]|nr:MAG: hypothetical protein BM562_06865 [Alphaproteobacteria bacterium MedPE-SWcel]